MELLLDGLRSAAQKACFHPENDPRQMETLAILLAYYESPLWRSDFEADARGELPQSLKRGILSEDGFYNFLTEAFPTS